MNLWQRARAARNVTVPPNFQGLGGWDGLASLYGATGNLNGEYEVSTASLNAVSESIYKQSGPVFALIAVRMLLFSEARFQYQQMRGGRPGDLFGDPSLSILEKPWPGGTTGDLLARCEQDVSLMGNAFVTDRVKPGRSKRLRRLRPDWVTMVYASEDDPELYGDAIDGELVAYLYTPRMPGGQAGEGTILYPEEVAHYAPYPDPEAQHRGMSWLTPVLREAQADKAALLHKESFFRNGAVPRLAMKIDPSIDEEDFDRLAEMIEAHHTGPWNAYKTLYLGGGADPLPLTFNLKDLDYKAVTGGGETRLAAAAGIHPVIVGFSEGLSGSSLNAGNYSQAKRRVGDGTLRPLWRNVAGAFETLVPPPNGARLWYDDRDIAFLRDDESDSAKIASERATTIRTLVDSGYEPESVAAAVQSGDFSNLKHTGLFSVQLQPPGNGTNPDANGGTNNGPAGTPGNGQAK